MAEIILCHPQSVRGQRISKEAYESGPHTRSNTFLPSPAVPLGLNFLHNNLSHIDGRRISSTSSTAFLSILPTDEP